MNSPTGEPMFAFCMLLHNRDMPYRGAIPESFCWTRFGSEAGQPANAILDRKERERQANHGTFLWGIGNAVGAAISELVRRSANPEVLFSPIKGKPRECDVVPDSVVVWRLGETLDYQPYSLPKHSLVTSRFVTGSTKSSHYALVCFSSRPIAFGDELPTLAFGSLRNILSGKHLGASQVTAVVTRDMPDRTSTYEYPLAFRARLVAPYFIRLREPLPTPIATEHLTEFRSQG
jgi:hypothetical protein